MKPSTISTIALALALVACTDAGTGGNATGGGAAPIAAPAGTTWTDTVAKSPAGGFVMGNPAAAVKLVEYGALSCSHCATFSEASSAPLKTYIAKGTVSYEFRPFLLGALDIPAFLLARCSGPGPFFALSEQMFASQSEWLGRTSSITPAEQQSWTTLPPEQLAPLLGAKLGLDSFVQQRGIGAAQAQKCLSDKAAIDELSAITQGGVDEFKVSGTPTFVINGKVDKTTDTWEKVEPALRAAGA